MVSFIRLTFFYPSECFFNYCWLFYSQAAEFFAKIDSGKSGKVTWSEFRDFAVEKPEFVAVALVAKPCIVSFAKEEGANGI